LEFVKILIFITVDIFKHTAKKIRKLNEQIKQNTNTEHKHFIYLDKQLIAIHIKTDTTSTAGTSDTTNTPATPIPDKTRYLHYDNLGSIDTITDGPLQRPRHALAIALKGL
jgi:hypothetical protein